ncbi:MAG: FG-GAP-like repeat-containing protein [Planctomycetota bacterium JB042]
MVRLVTPLVVSSVLAFASPSSAAAADLSLAGSTAPGETVELTFRGTPGGPLLLFLGAGFATTPIPVDGGAFHIDVAALWFFVSLGTLPTPELTIPAQVPPQPALVGAVVHLQAAAPSVTNPVSVALRAPDVERIGAAAGDRLGAMVLPTDFDQDGTADFFVSAETPTGAGRVDLFSGPGATPVTSLADPTPEAGSLFGQALAVGDVTGDGKPDLVVGAPKAQASAGEVWVFAGPSLAPPGLIPAPAGSGAGGFGTALAAGDFDLDGQLDVVVGSPGETVAGKLFAGRVRVYSGSFAAPKWTLDDPTPSFPGLFGGALDAGDADLDGRDDLLVGAPSCPVGGIAGAGEAWLFSGPFVAPPLLFPDPQPTTNGAFGCRVKFGDVTAGPRPEVLVGTPGGYGDLDQNPGGLRVGEVQVFVDGDPNAVIELFDPTFEDFQHFGMDVSAADVNGDGREDLIVGAFLGDRPGVTDAGQTFVLLGPDLQQTFFVTPRTGSANAQFGVFGDAADVDGDGRAELLITAPLHSSGPLAETGAVYVVDLF